MKNINVAKMACIENHNSRRSLDGIIAEKRGVSISESGTAAW